MIEIKVHGGPDGPNGLTVSGHAGYADRGEDIVCAGVSALAETLLIGLRQVARIKPAVTRQDGFVDVRLPAQLSGEAALAARVILETTIAGLRDVARSYPDYVTFSA